MVSLKEIRRRIQSIDNVEQITKSMEMIAATRFQKAHTKAIHSNKYIQGMREVISHLITANTEKKHPLFVPGTGSRVAIVVAGADRGLCGAYNSNLFNALDLFLKNRSHDSIELILFGRKAIDYYSRKKWSIGLTVPEWGGKITLESINKISHDLIEQFLNGDYSSIRLLYTQHQTVFSRQLINKQLFPLEMSDKEPATQQQDYIFEPNIEEIFTKLLPRYCSAEIYNMLTQAYASELAARVCAMRAAANNARDIIEKLTLERNKLRQTSITKEVLEISSGAEAL